MDTLFQTFGFFLFMIPIFIWGLAGVYMVFGQKRSVLVACLGFFILVYGMFWLCGPHGDKYFQWTQTFGEPSAKTF